MRAMLPHSSDLSRKVRDLVRAHRAELRTRTYGNADLNPPAGPCEVVPVVAADGARLRVHAYGPADGDVIVLVHGWTCCLEYWNPQINAFAGEYRVIAYDVRGHGESELGTAPLTTDRLADDLADVLDTVLQRGQRAVLVGHRLGGMTIQAWAGRYPHRVQRQLLAVLLTNTAAGDLIAETTVIPFLNRGLARLPFRAGLLGLSAPILFPPIAPVRWIFRRQIMSLATVGHLAEFGLNIVRSCPARVRGRFGTLLSHLDVGRGAAKLTVPTTVIAGSADDMTPPVHSERIVEMLTEAGSLDGYKILPTGHLGNVEAYQEFNVELARVAKSAFGIPARVVGA
ncbi:alpha/beta fold hydrolase [Nocardia seriolae]|nr:alpha/beta hydrolase [Nocardia seriolae]MTJ60480.1 alpha/beta fold hydrolase [Nocardia seriolae]MTJ74948.1 alpha/beta fold hydrolase [Nocardia seriolae]MTJ84633.1 alpha/beta fold hydrolase [Nocardia seriolae]MTK28621.1 alpha/beta fold hydrolase [Nocardia seriolae]MTK38463.1 alpha/beta fold hydrolase [Nocardia seriolae]